MHLDRVGFQIDPRPDSRLEALARKDAIASNPDRGNADNVVLARVEARRFAVDGDGLVRRRGFEQEAIVRISQEAPINVSFERKQHQNIARLKWRRSISRNCLTIWKASRRRSRSIVDNSPGLTRLVDAASAIWASSL